MAIMKCPSENCKGELVKTKEGWECTSSKYVYKKLPTDAEEILQVILKELEELRTKMPGYKSQNKAEHDGSLEGILRGILDELKNMKVHLKNTAKVPAPVVSQEKAELRKDMSLPEKFKKENEERERQRLRETEKKLFSGKGKDLASLSAEDIYAYQKEQDERERKRLSGYGQVPIGSTWKETHEIAREIQNKPFQNYEREQEIKQERQMEALRQKVIDFGLGKSKSKEEVPTMEEMAGLERWERDQQLKRILKR